MLVNRWKPYIIQCRHHLLCQPDVFVLIAHFDAVLLVTNGSNVGQVLRRTGTDVDFVFLLVQAGFPLIGCEWQKGVFIGRCAEVLCHCQKDISFSRSSYHKIGLLSRLRAKGVSGALPLTSEFWPQNSVLAKTTRFLRFRAQRRQNADHTGRYSRRFVRWDMIQPSKCTLPILFCQE